MPDTRHYTPGPTGTGKTHLVTAIGAKAVNERKRVRFFSAVDLVNKLETEHREGTSGRLTDKLSRVDLLIIHCLAGHVYMPEKGRAGISTLRGLWRKITVPSHQQTL